MFNSSNLYNLLKPKQEQNMITNYEVIIGGTNLTANLEKGCIILSLINSTPLTSFDYNMKDIISTPSLPPRGYVKGSNIIQNTYQIDIYKVNDINARVIEVEVEALKIREWLKSMQVYEYLNSLNSQILPCYSTISYTSEQYNKKFVNRAFFDFDILTFSEIQEEVLLVDNISIENIDTNIKDLIFLKNKKEV